MNNIEVVAKLFKHLNNRGLINGYVVNDKSIQFQTLEGKMVLVNVKSEVIINE